MLWGFSNSPSHSALNLLHIRFDNTVVQGIKIVKSAGDKSTGKRDESRSGTKSRILWISLICKWVALHTLLIFVEWHGFIRYHTKVVSIQTELLKCYVIKFTEMTWHSKEEKFVLKGFGHPLLYIQDWTFYMQSDKLYPTKTRSCYQMQWKVVCNWHRNDRQ